MQKKQNDLEDAWALAEKLARVCDGHDTAHVYAAMSILMGRAEATAERPDVNGLIRIIEKTVRSSFKDEFTHRHNFN